MKLVCIKNWKSIKIYEAWNDNQKKIFLKKRILLQAYLKSLFGLNLTIRLDYVPFQYYFCNFFLLLFNFKFFFNEQRMPASTFMNFAKRDISALSELHPYNL